jgi:hypothetical protein
MTIDLIDEYGYRNIEGADRGDIYRALTGRIPNENQGKGQAFTVDYGTKIASLVHVATGRKVRFGCMHEYFEPKEDYYNLNSKSECAFVQKALGLPSPGRDCVFCLRLCLESKLKIKPKKLRIAGSYFLR